MSLNQFYADRLYNLVPLNYRAYDREQGGPLRMLLELVGEQAANLRRDLTGLWDNFFIETCDDWVVPYLAALVGTNLPARAIGQSNRLQVRNTVLWRQRKGTPVMLAELARAVSDWNADLAEYFSALGWAQNVNHVRLTAPITVDVRDPYRLSRLGHADDPWDHAADIRPSGPLDQPRVTKHTPFFGQPAWGTPGRHQIKNLGLMVRRLQTYLIGGSTPASVPPGAPEPDAKTEVEFRTFDPLFRDIPLFVNESRVPLTRADFGAKPSETFGRDVAIRQAGVLLATELAPSSVTVGFSNPRCFMFGRTDDTNTGDLVKLQMQDGLQLMDVHSAAFSKHPFRISVHGTEDGAELGHLSTYLAHVDQGSGFQNGVTDRVSGLVVKVRIVPVPGKITPPAAHFPGSVLAVRAVPRRQGATRITDAIYVYLPEAVVTPRAPLICYVADDGSTFESADLSIRSLLRQSQGQVYPPRPLTSSPTPASGFDDVDTDRDLAPISPDRFDVPRPQIRAELVPGGPAPNASRDSFRTGRFLGLRVMPLEGGFAPATEVIVRNRRGNGLLVYLPEIERVPEEGKLFLVADDGATYEAPTGAPNLTESPTLAALGKAARQSAGQVVPVPGKRPLLQRRAVALDLCCGERRALLQPDEIGIDTERGRFAFPPGDPLAFGRADLSVDYVEAFSADVGARTFSRDTEDCHANPEAAAQKPTIRYVSAAGVAHPSEPTAPYDSLEHALRAVKDPSEIIEIMDSSTYAVDHPLVFNKPNVTSLVIRAAAKQRPCLTFYATKNEPTDTSLEFRSRLAKLQLNGLLISGGPIQIKAKVEEFKVFACTLDPLADAPASLTVPDNDSAICVCRSITGGLLIGGSKARLVVADSIVDRQEDPAISGCNPAGERQPAGDAVPEASCGNPPAADVHLERVTVIGQVSCEKLTASECLFDDLVHVNDLQEGCVRYSRVELRANPKSPAHRRRHKSSVLPRRFECIPTDDQLNKSDPRFRCLAPLFNSRRFGRPDYCQLATGCPKEILQASTEDSEIGAFTIAFNTIRLANLKAKLAEFLPAGLKALILSET